MTVFQLTSSNDVMIACPCTAASRRVPAGTLQRQTTRFKTVLHKLSTLKLSPNMANVNTDYPP